MRKLDGTLLITGGCGFIGSNFVEYMFHRHQDLRIMVLDALTYAGQVGNIPEEIRKSDRFEFWYGNVCNSELVGELVAKCNHIVHMAAQTHVSRSIHSNREFFETDVIGTQTVCNAVAKNPDISRFIHISTSEVYGTAQTDYMHEDHPLDPTSPYAAAKAGADRLVYAYWKTYDIPAVIIRPFNNYGPRQHPEKVIPRFITNGICQEKLLVHGSGWAKRDWVHVLDHCRALELALDPGKNILGEIINIGTGISWSIRNIAEMISETYMVEIEHTPDRPGQVERHTASWERAKDLLGWQPTIPFYKGLEDTRKWYANNRDKWMPLRGMMEVPVRLKDGSIVRF